MNAKQLMERLFMDQEMVVLDGDLDPIAHVGTFTLDSGVEVLFLDSSSEVRELSGITGKQIIEDMVLTMAENGMGDGVGCYDWYPNPIDSVDEHEINGVNYLVLRANGVDNQE